MNLELTAQIFSTLIDVAAMVFTLLIYTELTCLKRNTMLYKAIMYSSCVLMLALYVVVTFVFKKPVAISAFVCMTLPSLVIFGFLSKFKDARFFVTFCFVDTLSLIVAFFARLTAIYFGVWGAVIGFVLTSLFVAVAFIKARPYCKRYRQILENIKHGWVPIMISMIIIYLLLIFSATYPRPLAERHEYISVYAAISVAVIFFYVVFIFSIVEKKSLYDLNNKLSSELHWHKIAFRDALTGMNNRTAYIEKINSIPRIMPEDSNILAVMTDIDGFKKVNDTFGHHVGDILLIKAAEVIKSKFPEPSYEAYRIGGDEFAIIAYDVPVDVLEEKLQSLMFSNSGISCEFSYGIAKVHTDENNAMENAFIRADAAMYKHKNSKTDRV